MNAAVAVALAQIKERRVNMRIVKIFMLFGMLFVGGFSAFADSKAGGSAQVGTDDGSGTALRPEDSGTVVSPGDGRATAADAKTVTSQRYVDKAVERKQKAFDGERDTVVMYTSTAGGVDSKTIEGDLSGNSAGLPKVDAVNAGLNKKQEKISAVPSARSGNIVTYTGTAGQVGERALYRSTQTYNSQGLVEASNVNKAISSGLNGNLSCNSNHGPNNECWLWTITTQPTGAVYTPNAGQ